MKGGRGNRLRLSPRTAACLDCLSSLSQVGLEAVSLVSPVCLQSVATRSRVCLARVSSCVEARPECVCVCIAPPSLHLPVTEFATDVARDMFSPANP